MKTITLFALASLSSVAAAQSVSINLTHDEADGVILIGESVTWALSIAFEGFPDGSTAGGGNISIAGSGIGTSSDMAYTVTNGGNNGGTSNGDGIGFVNWTNSLFIESVTGGANPADRSNPFTVGLFTFTGSAVGTVDYALSTGQGVSAFVVINTSPASTVDFSMAQTTISIDSLLVREVPTPASAALIALGGLLTSRRRR